MTKIYERVGDIVYEREFGEFARTPTKESQKRADQNLARLKEDRLWGEIRRAAEHNKTLQHALEQCIIIYKLSEEYKDGI
jgi:hypothetical protein